MREVSCLWLTRTASLVCTEIFFLLLTGSPVCDEIVVQHASASNITPAGARRSVPAIWEEPYFSLKCAIFSESLYDMITDAEQASIVVRHWPNRVESIHQNQAVCSSVAACARVFSRVSRRIDDLYS